MLEMFMWRRILKLDNGSKGKTCRYDIIARQWFKFILIILIHDQRGKKKITSYFNLISSNNGHFILFLI